MEKENIDEKSELPSTVVSFFKKNPLLESMLSPSFDPFQHFVLSDNFDVEETLKPIGEGLSLVDEELENILAKSLPTLREHIDALNKLKTLQASLVMLCDTLQHSLNSVKEPMEKDLVDAQDSFSHLKEVKETLDAVRLLSTRPTSL